MEIQTKMWRYLFKLPLNVYNNEKSYYELNPMPISNQERVVAFAGKRDGGINNLSIVYVYLELSEELNNQNIFANLQRLLNIIYLETGLPTHYVPVQIEANDDFTEVFSKFSSGEFYHPGVSYSGTAPQHNHISRAEACVDLMIGLNKKNFEKFDNALNTYIWALELRELPNPHLKYTLYMTLFLSAINQLANDPEYCAEHPICEKCSKKLTHQLKGEKQAIQDLMKELLTGEALDQGISKFKKLYSELRSSFLHSGKLSGGERDGGFLFDVTSSSDLLVNEMETIITCRQLLEQFLVKRQQALTKEDSASSVLEHTA